ncbi:hypothetical protein [Pseudomonas iridis]|uniref:hypothetical protein n=1 Tax=Pseudomonas iridis TaxID=2710587 RepID=UPI001B3455FC|nr:hypothetical protein [Pseudomonas iridis]MBP5969417.1 hypothetical protein [Pseudomonas iridis]
MLNIFWRLLAKLLARQAVSDWLIARAQRTPYLHIMSADGAEMYMGRWWLFNPYDRDSHRSRLWWCPWSVRIHHIKRPDNDRDLHDHPWNARTIILRGGYTEQRLLQADDPALQQLLMKTAELRQSFDAPFEATEYIDRRPGDTASLSYGEYHRIDSVVDGGAFTLFISGPYQGTWGFLVSGVKVPWRTYTGNEN